MQKIKLKTQGLNPDIDLEGNHFEISYLLSLNPEEHFLIPKAVYRVCEDHTSKLKKQTVISYRFEDKFLTLIEKQKDSIFGVL